MTRIAHRGCLLVVDDEPDVAASISDYFQRQGYDVDTAGTLANGQAFLATNRYDAVITDLNLPDGTAFDLLPSCPRWSGCRAVVISGRLDQRTTARAFEMGATAAIPKPVSLGALKAALTGSSEIAV